MIAEMMGVPREDLVSMLARAEVDGDRLTDPEQKRALRSDPSLIPNAVEEMLRWWTPVRGVTRHAGRATSLRGKPIGEGDCVLLLYPAANRDEEVWGEDAERFDVRRDHAHRRPLAFGFGEHLCLGAPLARLEARVMFEELFVRLPEFELAGPVERLRSRLMNAIERMPVVFKA